MKSRGVASGGSARSHFGAWAALAVLFSLSRAVYYWLGVRYDASTLGIFWQFLDPELLRQDLLESLFLLHSQPPLFNLFLGGVLKQPVLAPAFAFQAIYFVLGFLCYAGLYWLMLGLGVTRLIALLVASLAMMRPSFVLLENWLMYDVPVTALLIAAAVCLQRALAHRNVIYLHSLFWLTGLLCGTRSLFHPVFLWLTAGATIVVAVRGEYGWTWRKVCQAAVIPLLLMTTLQVKNAAYFGHPATSSWLGMNVMRIVGSTLPASDLAALQEAGRVSRLSSIPPFSSLESYRSSGISPQGGESDACSDAPALSAVEKSTGAPNFNHLAYVDISRAYLDDALQIVHHRPKVYAYGMAKAWYNYFKPQSRIPHLRENRQRLSPWIDGFEAVLYGELADGFEFRGEGRSIYLVSFLGIPGLLCLALAWSVKGSGLTPERRVTLLFLCATTLYVAFVGNSLEVWENQRFRFYTDAFTAVFLALALQRTFEWRESRRSRAVSASG